MNLQFFGVRKIGRMLRDMDPQFSRCEVVIGIRDPDSEAVNEITLDLVIAYQETEAVGSLQNKIAAEAARVLAEAARILAGNDVQALNGLVDADAKALEKMSAERWERSHPPT